MNHLSIKAAICVNVSKQHRKCLKITNRTWKYEIFVNSQNTRDLWWCYGLIHSALDGILKGPGLNLVSFPGKTTLWPGQGLNPNLPPLRPACSLPGHLNSWESTLQYQCYPTKEIQRFQTKLIKKRGSEELIHIVKIIFKSNRVLKKAETKVIPANSKNNGYLSQWKPKVITKNLLDTLHPNININILHTVLCTLTKVLTRRICLTIKSFFSWWSFPLFSWQ